MFTTEPSYFNFLMEHRCGRRVRVPFARAAGLMPEVACAERARRSQRERAASPSGGSHLPGMTSSR